MSLRMVAHLALIALGLYFTVDAGMTVVAHVLTPETSIVAPRRAKAKKSEQAQAKLPVSRIVERNLFGKAALVGPSKSVQAEPVKREIGLDLVGTVVADADQGVAAIIFDRAGKAQDFFRVGQPVRPGVTLKSVQRKSAVLGTAQGDVLLTMGDDLGTASASEQPPESGSSSDFALNRETIEESMQNLGQVMQQAQIERVSRGDTKGYRLSSIQSGSVFERLNLQNGDIVTGINGQEITDPNQFTELYNSLPQHDTVTVNLYRRGRKHDLTFTLQ
ncbi:MAG: type II secretion system protein N [Desulfocurvibacter africanus]